MRHLLFGLSIMLVVVWIRAEILADYQYDREIGSYWQLSIKASSLQAKADYLDKFVASLRSADLGGNNALFLSTPDNSYDQNLNALTSLQTRMHEIRGMDVTSFAYQQAIQQITAQEQDEAGKLTDTFHGIWYLRHHFFLWDWVDAIAWLIIAGGFLATGIWELTYVID